MRSQELSDGYGVDEPVGLLFENEVLVKSVGSTKNAEGFWIEKKGDEIVETPLEIEYIGDGDS